MIIPYEIFVVIISQIYLSTIVKLIVLVLLVKPLSCQPNYQALKSIYTTYLYKN